MIISTIGSCRVAGPMTKLQAQRNFVLDNRLLYGFTHNTKKPSRPSAICARRDHAAGKRLGVHFQRTPRESNPAHAHPADARHVVEIPVRPRCWSWTASTCSWCASRSAELCPELPKIFFDHTPRATAWAKRAALREAPSFAHVPEHVQHALTHGHARRTPRRSWTTSSPSSNCWAAPSCWSPTATRSTPKASPSPTAPRWSRPSNWPRAPSASR